jgi:hypothetical protein
LRKAEKDKIVVTEGPMIEMERQRRLEEDPKADVSQINSVEVSLAELRCLLPSDKYPDDAEFRTVIEQVGYFELEGIGIYFLRATLMRPDDNDFNGIIFASESVLNGYTPKCGDSIEGVMWLQGALISS